MDRQRIKAREANRQWDLNSSVPVGERHGLRESKRETETETKECRGWLQRTKKGTEQYSA